MPSDDFLDDLPKMLAKTDDIAFINVDYEFKNGFGEDNEPYFLIGVPIGWITFHYDGYTQCPVADDEDKATFQKFLDANPSLHKLATEAKTFVAVSKNK